MRRLGILLAVVILLIIGGGLTSQIASTDRGQAQFPAVVRDTDDPNASALDMTPWKAEQLFLFIGFILANLVGATVTLALVMWFLSRQVKSVKRSGAAAKSAAVTTEQAN